MTGRTERVMLPDEMLDEIKKMVAEHFESSDRGLMRAATLLANDGYTYEAMRPILSNAYFAGYRDGVVEAM